MQVKPFFNVAGPDNSSEIRAEFQSSEVLRLQLRGFEMPFSIPLQLGFGVDIPCCLELYGEMMCTE